MVYAIEYTTRAAKFLQGLPPRIAQPLFDSIERLSEHPRPKGSKRRRENEWTFWIHLNVGAHSYAVDYEIREQRIIIVILDVAETKPV